MATDGRRERRAAAAVDFNAHLQRDNGERISASLDDGLSLLRDLLFTRVHVDVERAFGVDSMLAPVSESKLAGRTKLEIEIYQVAESTALARDNGYVAGREEWYLNWLGRLRLGEGLAAVPVTQRLSYYAAKSAEERPRAFGVLLERTLPEAARAPLIVWRLFPLAVAIVTCLAFGDHARAQDNRRRQTQLLSIIADCRACHGGLLENGEKCAQCGNPFWKYEWLIAE